MPSLPGSHHFVDHVTISDLGSNLLFLIASAFVSVIIIPRTYMFLRAEFEYGPDENIPPLEIEYITRWRI